ncbi:thiamine-phosphate kinase [Stutzerimonas xanthomarina]|uniref:Thiamine-monophosphate kinase n=2 Tax=Stutzerimonas xanthomarina TaxID=271420 RepID=A0A1M5KF00_9GAMM|nr:thiamine-phosphate kinase [Stutzerimonas xanthomarina]MCP9337076.1 thiamine-phosphate kinase [Stutzerimonas xanthomarina]SEI06141.1 thiamine-monophosphate kinase [Stutzerimonas xanthomarina]SHG51285.1 thiamine-phosphate kinase [Stutzerimonas xanthomarina DSM 18231]
MDEFELIRHYFAAAACARVGGDVALGIGDDCALLSVPVGEQLAVSTDTLVAGVHFSDPCDPYLLGQRALAVSTSDLAGMGATPIGFTLALTIPSVDPDWLSAFARGLDTMAAGCDMRLIGGDTTRGPLSVTLTVFGRVPVGQALLRSGAKPGDLLCVGGSLGDAAGALPIVLGEREADTAEAAALLRRYWSPQPQLALGQALRGKATAALDISDGLLADCNHIATASSVSLVIEQARVPLSDSLLRFAGTEQALQCALGGGDDYLLAFTLPADALPSMQSEGWPVHVIGHVEVGEGVRLVDADGRSVGIGHPGYNHFTS